MRMSGWKVRGSPKLQSCIVQVSRVPCQCWRKVWCIKVMYFLLANKKLASACFPRQKACWDFGSRQEKRSVANTGLRYLHSIFRGKKSAGGRLTTTVLIRWVRLLKLRQIILRGECEHSIFVDMFHSKPQMSTSRWHGRKSQRITKVIRFCPWMSGQDFTAIQQMVAEKFQSGLTWWIDWRNHLRLCH